MALWNVYGQLVNDADEGVPIPEHAVRVSTFRNPAQYGSQEFAWEPQNRFFSGDIQENAPGYLTELFGRLERQKSGQLQPWEAEELAKWEATARAMPTRDIASLTAGWQGEPGTDQWWSQLDPGSPDAGPIMLALRDKMDAGTATPQERELYGRDAWAWRRIGTSAPLCPRPATPLTRSATTCSVPLARWPLALPGAWPGARWPRAVAWPAPSARSARWAALPARVPACSGRRRTRNGCRSLAWAWVPRAASPAGVGGLANLWSTGVQVSGDAARLASNAGRVVGGVGALPITMRCGKPGAGSGRPASSAGASTTS